MIVTNRPLPIAWSVRNAYAEREGLKCDDYELFMRMIRALDAEYLKITVEQAKTQMNEMENDG